jgi:hypothetical protein
VSYLNVQVATAAPDWIDVHFHVVGDKGEMQGFARSIERVEDIMESSHMRQILIMSPPRPFESFDIDELLEVQKQAPDRIAIMGGGGSLNHLLQEHGDDKTLDPALKQKFTAIAEDILAKGAKGFGELTAHHVSLNPGHGYEWIPPDSPLLLLLADIAAQHDVPIDLHLDPIPEDVPTPSELHSPRNPKILKENVSGFERLLDHNPKTRIVWAHAGSDPVGFFTPELVSTLMRKHPNLYCSVRTTHKRNNPMRHPRDGINTDWIEVLNEFPDRFVMGTDSFVITEDYTGPNGPRVLARKTWVQREGANEVLGYLSEDVAKKLAYQNALRIYKLSKN